jgi:DNA-directed RNA polymerase specialized sigma24 family protein
VNKSGSVESQIHVIFGTAWEVARAKGKLRGKQPKLSERQQKELRRMHDTGDYSISDLADLLSISRLTVYQTLDRQPCVVSKTA